MDRVLFTWIKFRDLIAAAMLAIATACGGHNNFPCQACVSYCLRKFPDDSASYGACLTDCYATCDGIK
jgi:hypothetical protein